MSSIALMRWLEHSPSRYDVGMRLLTFGRIAELHAAVADAAARDPADNILEVGCGTGSVTVLLLDRGARVTAIDQSPEMLELAAARIEPSHATRIEWLEQTASEIDKLASDHFDSVVICLCLSDMSATERGFVLREAAIRLAPGGRLVCADEIRPAGGWQRVLQALWRLPQAALGWLLVGSVSRPIPDLKGEVLATGLRFCHEQTWLLGSLSLVVAERER
jgi:demethylmenaquinone methyltransferase/2-methoxy-6-polyprenyl-1,4-benzoquinol methylase